MEAQRYSKIYTGIINDDAAHKPINIARTAFQAVSSVLWKFKMLINVTTKHPRQQDKAVKIVSIA